MSELVGKKKRIINYSNYGSRARVADHAGPFTGMGYATKNASPLSGEDGKSFKLEEGNNKIVFLNKGVFLGSESNIGYGGQDTLRMAMGKNWDLLKKDSSSDKEEFGNDWTPLAIWYGAGLELEYCDLPEEVGLTADGEIPAYSDTSNWYSDSHRIAFESNMVTEQKIAIKCDLSSPPYQIEEFNNNPSQAPDMAKWMILMKTGFADGTATSFKTANWNPIVPPPNKHFTDHYHETSIPFTKKELNSKQPFGKSSFANINTFYNERAGSAARSGGRNLSFEYRIRTDAINKSIPNIYGFLDILSNDIDLQKLYEEIMKFNDGNAHILAKHPFGVLTTFFGKIDRQTIEKFTKINFDRDDVTAFYEDYFDEWGAAANPDDDFWETLGLYLLETAFTNIAFSPNMTKIIDKAEKYKKYFPFYSELQFSAKILTGIGDAIQKTLMTKYFSTVIAQRFTFKSDATTLEKTDERTDQSKYAWKNNPGLFYDLYEEKVYKDINADGQLSEAELVSPSSVSNQFLNAMSGEFKFNQKEIMRIFKVLKEFLDNNEDHIYPEEDGLDLDDVQNYLSFLRNEQSEPVDINECNAIFKTVLGNALLNKLIDTYKEHRRDYKDILDGVPAYTEDIFYRIEKLVKYKGKEEFEHLQNIIIPNTSELDIVKYIDTQVKYADEAVYKYNVYAERIVFGCSYRYFWIDIDSGQKQFPGANYILLARPDIGNIPVPPSPSKNGNMTGLAVLDYNPEDKKPGIWTAALKVKIEPNIVMMEDLLFTTPEVMILDRPPIAPDVNIIPYRAVNNRIKILFNGMVDRYRDFPVFINEQIDKPNFDLIAKAQFSPDGKIEFGSDDPINSFEIFRIDSHPKQYTDFKLYKKINASFFEEEILPNKKYYYTFRAIDIHNHVSNPTAIFEVELIDDNGAVKPMIRIVNLQEDMTEQNFKECQKYIYIKPTPQQVYTSGQKGVDYIFTDDSKNQENTKRKFKIRLTSKATGKKIDVNVAFKKKRNTVKT